MKYQQEIKNFFITRVETIFKSTPTYKWLLIRRKILNDYQVRFYRHGKNCLILFKPIFKGYALMRLGVLVDKHLDTISMVINTFFRIQKYEFQCFYVKNFRTRILLLKSCRKSVFPWVSFWILVSNWPNDVS